MDELRAQVGAATWVDTGDLAQGSALGALSDGVWPFLALRELSIDVAVVGNHELDWGADHLRRWGAELPFPLLAANLPLGLPATWSAGELGVVGVSLPAMAELHPGLAAAADTAALVAEHAAELRRAGARRVALALHDGVYPRGDVRRMEAVCTAVRDSVDLVLGGHTLGCHAGLLAGVPFLQPWAFGSQVGVADLRDDGGVDLRVVDVGPARTWTGAGARAQAALEADVVGELERPLFDAAGAAFALARAVAEGVLARGDGLDGVYVGPGDVWNQPARDGVHAFLGPGQVTMAQVLRLTPFTGGRSAWGGQLVAAELPADEAERAVAALLRSGGAALTRAGRRGGRLALTPFAAATADRLLGREHDWEAIEITLRDGLLAAVGA